MTWSLEIHHLDIQSVGDATIIVAKESDVVKRTVLIDGGKNAAGKIIDAYFDKHLTNVHVDVIVVTHYDKDHFEGILAILADENNPRYKSTLIHDPGYYDFTGKTQKNKQYDEYRKLATKAARVHVTGAVNSDAIVPFEHSSGVDIANKIAKNDRKTSKNKNGYYPPYLLVGREIMWKSTSDKGNSYSDDWKTGAPRLTCIAANKYVLQKNGDICFVSKRSTYGEKRATVQTEESKEEDANANRKSLAFLLEFNNFRYYVGGDLESAQEDGCEDPNVVDRFLPGVRSFVNPDGTYGDRILVMKTSHHGGNTSTSRVFLNHLRPRMAIISTGSGNQHDHPGQRTVNVLDGHLEQPANGDASTKGGYFRHPPAPPSPSYLPVANYITGFKNPDKFERLGGDVSETAGNPKDQTPGHLVVLVNETQSKRSRLGQRYLGIRAAADAVGQWYSLDSKQVALCAEVAATFGAASGAACAVGLKPDMKTDGLTFNQHRAVAEAARYVAVVGPDAKGTGVIEAVFEAKTNHATAADAVTGVADMGQWDQDKKRAAYLDKKLAVTIACAMDTNNTASDILNAASGADVRAAKAASVAAASVRDELVAQDGAFTRVAGYAVAAAFGAAKSSVHVTDKQAAVIAAAIGAMVSVPNALDDDLLAAAPEDVAKIVTRVALKVGIAKADAVLAGAVAGAAFYDGEPADAGAAVEAALLEANENATKAGTAGSDVANAGKSEGELFKLRWSYSPDLGKNTVKDHETPFT